MPALTELRGFVLRREVIKLYRACMRDCRRAPRDTQADTKEYIRSSFAIHREKEDLYDIKYALSDGREQLKRWREMLGLSCIGQKGEPARYSPSNTRH